MYQLSEEPEFVDWPKFHYVYVEKVGSIPESAKAAWTELHPQIETISKNNKITGYTTLYKCDPAGVSGIYRAGVSIENPPVGELPPGFKYCEFHGGRYAKFILTGAYDHLPEACGRVFKMVKEKQIPTTEEFNIENYINDPRVTPKEQLKTEICIATV